MKTLKQFMTMPKGWTAQDEPVRRAAELAAVTDPSSLKVVEGFTKDILKGIVRIDYDIMDVLNVSTGDVIEIIGKRRTVAKCLPQYPSDEGKGIIRIDALIRNNLVVEIGDTVSFRKIKAVDAETVELAPFEIKSKTIDETFLQNALEYIPVIQGDNIIIRYFNDDEDLRFQAIKVTPSDQAVLITKKTNLYVRGMEIERIFYEHDNPLQILKIRLAKGEITTEEFHKIKDTLK